MLEERLITRNRPGMPLTPQGVVVHSTANPGATAEDHWRYWSSADRQSSAHYVVDWERILRLIPENEIAWHAGTTANRTYMGIEMAEPKPGPDAIAQFSRVWDNTIWLLADVCRRYGWQPTPDRVLSHADISRMYPAETDHQDPIGYLATYGKTMDDLRAAVAQTLSMPQANRQVVPILDPTGRKLAEGWLDSGRTVVPLRDLAEAMGLRVSWDPNAMSATLSWPGRG